MPKNTNIEETYQKLTQLEHIRKLPDTYIGSTELNKEIAWIINKDFTKIHELKIDYIHGFYKIFDELVVNAYDQYVRLLQNSQTISDINFVKNIKINVDRDTGIISIYNDGDGIDIDMHKEHKMYVPTLIFGELLTGTNYDDDENPEEKLTGGKNGYGAKLTNIFSLEFTIETVDPYRKKKFVQTFKNNMTERMEPIITKCTSKPYTKITYLPDYKRFGLKGLSNDVYHLFAKRAYDVSACTDPTVSVYFNDEKIACKSFEKYIDLFLPSDFIKVHEHVNNRWEIGASVSPTSQAGGNTTQFQQISFVNGIFTGKGGKHVEYITNALCKKLSEYILKKKKINIKVNYIKENLMIFVKANIVNPSFDSQTKDYLTTNASKFGSKCELNDKFVEQVAKCGIMEKAIETYESKENKKLKTDDGKKVGKIHGIPKLEDANWAGGSKSKECTLILTEGDSAASMAVAGLSVVGRDSYGVFPLRGKVLNVKDIDKLGGREKIMNNEELKNLKKILGLQTDTKYTTVDKLRYGRIMIMTDQDVDGSHIKGLIFNVFHSLWIDLMKIDRSFITAMATPIVKVWKGSTKISFFNLSDYENWKETTNEGKGWNTKYYKGLGTSSSKEAKEYFTDLKVANYKWTDETNDAINLAFKKDLADDRKEWLRNYDKNGIINVDEKNVGYDRFINKELIHFSNYDNLRSIPSMCDGFKPSQRKLLYSCFKRNLKTEIKVAQLAGYTSEHSAYHHGEVSLHGTIIGMAHDFVGSNNINLLEPSGQFGTRRKGGSDSASPRYIFTRLEPITRELFQQTDDAILTYLYDDGMKIEPEFYVPILPNILINGSEGIGTGFSTTVHCYNPLELVKCFKNKLDDKPVDDIHPWFEGFTGNVVNSGNGSYITTGIFALKSYNTIEITELPIGRWIHNYKEFLDKECEDTATFAKKKADASTSATKTKKPKETYIKDYVSNCTDSIVSFTVEFKGSSLKKLLEEGGLERVEKELRLTSKISTRNMHLFNRKGQIQKYNTVNEIIDEFYDIRKEYYVLRKKNMLKNLKKEMNELNEKVRFINDVIEEHVIINKRTRDNIHQQLENKDYLKVNDDYKYLTGMPIYSLSLEKKEELENEASKKNEEYKTLKNTTIETMWSNELDSFVKSYKDFLKKRKASQDAPTKIKTIKSKKTKAV